MSQGGAGAGALAANSSEPGAFPLLKTTEPAPALLPKKAGSLRSGWDLRPQSMGYMPSKRTRQKRMLGKSDSKQKCILTRNVFTLECEMKRKQSSPSRVDPQSRLGKELAHVHTHREKDWKDE